MAVRRLFTRIELFLILLVICFDFGLYHMYTSILFDHRGSFTDEGTIIREGFGLWIPKFSLGLQIMP